MGPSLPLPPLLLGHCPLDFLLVGAWDPASAVGRAQGMVSGTGAGGMGIKPSPKSRKIVHVVRRFNTWSRIKQVRKETSE